MGTINATNGYSVRYICRYRDVTYYRVWKTLDSRNPRELRISDDGGASLDCGDQPTAEILAAFHEYKTAEHEQYIEWRKANAELLGLVAC